MFGRFFDAKFVVTMRLINFNICGAQNLMWLFILK